MATSPFVEGTNLISFTILSEGTEIPSTYEVLSIRTEQFVNRVAEAEIVLRDGNTAKQTFAISDSDTFKPGNEIEIKLGYENLNDSVYKGVVVKQAIKIENNDAKLVVTLKDKTLALTLTRKNGIFTDVKDQELITEIAQDYGVTANVDSTTVLHKEIVQYYATDWDFIVNRAEVNGLMVITDSGSLTVAKPNVSAAPELQLQYGYDIMEFDGELDATYQYSGVAGNSWDIASQSVIDATATEPTVNDQGDISGATLANVLNAGTNELRTTAPIDEEAIQEWADAALLKSRLSQYKGDIIFQGSAKAKVNSTIKLLGLGNRFNGNALITGVVHTIADGQWYTETKIGWSDEWFAENKNISGPIAAGLLPGIKGLQTGIVKQIYEDPDNEFRVQVSIPILGIEGEAVWARLTNFYTGNGFGAFFMPEVDDEVVLGFMNDDPRFPIILGSVYSSAIPAPEEPNEENTIKTLVTQSKLELRFDEENKVVTIQTPEGNSMVLTEEDKGIVITDQNGNSITMNDEGVVVESKSKLTLKASEEVEIEGSSVKISGSESIDASGGSVSVSGEQSTSISGSASCDISSDGQMSVKGLTVMIN
ncbi:MAG: type VI secretion system tip protein VgrG [Bacteroidota bacterium]